MEDLKDPNRGNGVMHNWNKNEIVDVSVAKLVMKKLATFHGIWISWLHNQEPKTLGNLSRNDIGRSFKTNKVGKRASKDWFNMLKAAEKQLQVLKKPEAMISKLRIFRKEKAYKVFSQVFFDVTLDNTKYATITHGDCWSNNFFLNPDNSEVYS